VVATPARAQTRLSGGQGSVADYASALPHPDIAFNFEAPDMGKVLKVVGGTARTALDATLEMYEITLAEHPLHQVPALDFRGTPTGIDVRRVVETGIQPVVNTGIAHRRAGVGQVGAGLVRAPLEPFLAAHRHLSSIQDLEIDTAT